MKKWAICLLFLLFAQLGYGMQHIQAKGMKELFSFLVNEENNEIPNFKDIEVTKKHGTYEVTGSVRVRKGVFYYTVEIGHQQFIPEKKIKINNLHWTSFKVKFAIPDDELAKNGNLILHLYEKNQSGEVSRPYPVVVDDFNE